MFGPVTQSVYTESQSGRLHPLLLLLLLLVLLREHRWDVLDGGGCGDDHRVGALPCQQILVDDQHTVQELCRHNGQQEVSFKFS